MEAILEDFGQVILPSVTYWNHPRFLAYFSISASAPGILGEPLTAALDVNAMLWKSCPTATELEQTTASWVLDWLQLPSAWFGMILDSGSNAVLQAIVAARQRAEPESRSADPSRRLVAYVSEHTHSSVKVWCGLIKEQKRSAVCRKKPRSLRVLDDPTFDTLPSMRDSG
jgi:aromatic-L-amino-acid/L-tryptophan decarboxylase